MPHKVVLLAMVGSTDLQCLVDIDGERFRSEISGNVRAFHEALLDRGGSLPCRVDGSLAHLPPVGQDRDNAVRWLAQEQGFDPKGLQPLKDEKTGKLLLVPAKLDEVLEAIRKEKDTEIVAAVLLNTHRTPTEDDPPDLKRATRNEPVAAGPLLARWCAETLELPGRCGENPGEYGLNRAGWVNYLEGKMMAEGEGRDFPVSRKAVKAVEEVIREIKAWGDDFSVCLSLGGGLPMMKDAVKACAEFFFTGRVFERHAPQMGKPHWVQPEEEPPAVAESYRTRRHAAHLIRQGDFAGAARSAEPFRNDKHERVWVNHLEQAAQYVAGILTVKTGVPVYLAALTRKDIPSSVLVALRVEAALTMDRIPEAVAWTCTLFDAALKDFIKKYLLDLFPGSRVDWLDEMVSLPKGVDPPEGLTEEIAYTMFGRPRRDPACLEKIEARWKINTETRRQQDRWMKEMRCKELRDLNERLKDNSIGRSPKLYRNMNLHGTIPPEIMQDARHAFENVGLWYSKEAGTQSRPSSKRVGTRLDASILESLRAKIDQAPLEMPVGEMKFLEQQLIKDLFKALDGTDVARLYRDLTEGLIQELYKHEVD